MKNIFLLIITCMLCSFAQAQVGIGTNTPDPSAVLELNDSAHGFLPPRIYSAKRDAIVSPAAGLTIWCIDCGNYGQLEIYNKTGHWTDMEGAAPSAGIPSNIAVGNSFRGGVVAYLLQSGDAGYDAALPHGLIAYSQDITAVPWNNGSYFVAGAFGYNIGDGNTNTNTIIAAYGAGNYAADNCANLSANGFTDWYLPSYPELQQLYANQALIGGFNTTVAYWSSSENSNTNAQTVFFGNGAPISLAKSSALNVRPVRSF